MKTKRYREPKGFPKGTLIEFVKNGRKYHIPYKAWRPYAVVYKVKPGTVPKAGDKGTVLGRTSMPGYYMVQADNHPVHQKEFGKVVCLAIHKSHLKRAFPENPKITYRIAKKEEAGAIQIGRVWIIGESAE